MLFNKGLALGGAMLVAAVPGQSAMLHAQSVQNNKIVTSTTQGGTRTVRVAGGIRTVTMTMPPVAMPVRQPNTIRTGVPAAAVPAAIVQAQPTPAPVAVAPAPAPAPVPAPAPAPAPVVTAPAPAPAPAPVETVTAPIVDTVNAVVDAVADAVSDAVDAVVEAAQAAVETVVAAVTPAPAPQPAVVATTAPVSSTTTTPSPTPAPVPTTSDNRASVEQSSTAMTAEPSVAKVFTVSNITELRTALGAAQGLAGAEIRVNPGSYGDLFWERKSYPLGRVYIVAATSEKPVFRQIVVNGSNNMSFHGMKVSGLQSGRLVMMNSARNMSFTGGELSGFTEDNRPFDESATAIQVRWSDNVVVQDNLFRDTMKAMYIQRSSNVFVRYNRMQYLREGLNVVATAGAVLRGNHFSHFFPRYDLAEHPDAIQFWTFGETVGSSKVRVQENLISMGGPRAVQGIFANAEAAGVRYSDFEVSRNVYFGSSVHGISLTGVDGLKISNNVVSGSPHADVNNSVRTASTSGGYMPQLRLRTSTAVTSWNNILMFTGANFDAATQPQLQQWDNWDIIDNIQKLGRPWTEYFVGGRPTVEAPELSAFITRNPSAAFTRNGGITAPFVHGVRPLTKNQELAEVRSLLAK